LQNRYPFGKFVRPCFQISGNRPLFIHRKSTVLKRVVASVQCHHKHQHAQFNYILHHSSINWLFHHSKDSESGADWQSTRPPKSANTTHNRWPVPSVSTARCPFHSLLQSYR